MEKFVYVNRISSLGSTVCTLYQMLRPFNRFRCSCNIRQT